MDLINNKVNHINYTRTTKTATGDIGDKSERHVIPTRIPKDTVTVIDVSALTDESRQVLLGAMDEYYEYQQERMATIMKFEDWHEHTKGVRPTALNWRTLKESSIEVIE